MTLVTILPLLISILALALAGTALLLIFRFSSGMTIKVEVAPPPGPVPDASIAPALAEAQKLLDDARQKKQVTDESLDSLITQLNNIMIGGE